MGLNWKAGAQAGLLTLGEGIMTKYERDLKNLENEAQFARQKTLQELQATNAKDLAVTQSSLREESAKNLAKFNAEQEIAQAGPRAVAEVEATHAGTMKKYELTAADIYKSLPKDQQAQTTLEEYTQEYKNLAVNATKGLSQDEGGEIFRQAITSWEEMKTTDPDGFDIRLAEVAKAAEAEGRELTPVQMESLAKQAFISETMGMAKQSLLQKPLRPQRKTTAPSPVTTTKPEINERAIAAAKEMAIVKGIPAARAQLTKVGYTPPEIDRLLGIQKSLLDPDVAPGRPLKTLSRKVKRGIKTAPTQFQREMSLLNR